jgi:hypothetical protein
MLTTDRNGAIAEAPDVDRCDVMPFDAVRPGESLRLRLGKTLNNQKVGVRWAGQYDFAATLGGSTLGP